MDQSFEFLMQRPHRRKSLFTGYCGCTYFIFKYPLSPIREISCCVAHGIMTKKKTQNSKNTVTLKSCFSPFLFIAFLQLHWRLRHGRTKTSVLSGLEAEKGLTLTQRGVHEGFKDKLAFWSGLFLWEKDKEVGHRRGETDHQGKKQQPPLLWGTPSFLTVTQFRKDWQEVIQHCPFCRWKSKLQEEESLIQCHSASQGEIWS